MLEKIMNEVFRMIGIIVVLAIVFALMFGLFGVTAQMICAIVIAISGIAYMFTEVFPKIIKGNKKVKKEGN